jgi:hypothetical protein
LFEGERALGEYGEQKHKKRKIIRARITRRNQMTININEASNNNKKMPNYNDSSSYDVLVYGSTPCAISAALAAARFGRKVALVANGLHMGGMMSSGLSITDLRFPQAFGGIFKELAGRVLAYYTDRYGKDSKQVDDCNGGIWFEPHVAETIFESMLTEQNTITVYRNRQLLQAYKAENAVTGIECMDRASGANEKLHAQVFIDGSYEGDLAAASGVEYHIGRESREAYGEPYAGFIFLKNPGLQVLEGSTGTGDSLIQAYNYRLCLTNRAELRVLPEKPEVYNRGEYTALIELCQSGKLKNFNDVIRLAPIPGGKFNGNNRPIAVSLDLPIENAPYPDADEEKRKRIIQRYRSYMTGLIWFVQNDSDIPEAFREEALTWGFCSDEFVDNGHVPYEFYVREARRIRGKKTFTALDAFLAPGSERTPIHGDSVAVGDYHVDSHIVQRPQPGWPQMEGHVYLRPISRPAQIPYGVIVPEQVQSLLVPGALSATHLGFSVLRMEPPWMALGQTAGTAAHLSLLHGIQPADVSVKELQKLLLEAGQVITFFYDVPGPDPVWWVLNKPGERTKLDNNAEEGPPMSCNDGLQYWGTKGFFSTYHARPYDPVTRSESVRWLCSFMEFESWDWTTDNTREHKKFSFNDISDLHPDYLFVQKLDRLGILDSWQGSGGFYSGAALSRQDAFQWIARTKACLASRARQEDSGVGTIDHLDNQKKWEQRIKNGLLPLSWKNNFTQNALFYSTREEFCELLFNVHMDVDGALAHNSQQSTQQSATDRSLNPC